MRLLFVGRDFQAKGGADLSAALEGLDGYELDIVTLTPLELPVASGVRVHNGLTPGEPLIHRLLPQADIAVLRTRGDSSPFAVLEAMSRALQVITTRVGAIAEIVVHGECGLLVEPGDIQSLGEHLITTLADAERRQALGEVARRRVEERCQASINAGKSCPSWLTLRASHVRPVARPSDRPACCHRRAPARRGRRCGGRSG